LRVRLTFESGLACSSFDEFWTHADRLMGYALYNHEFGLEETWENLQIALAAAAEGVPCRFRRRLGPLDTLRLMMPDKPILAIDRDTMEVFVPEERGVRP